MVSMKVLSQKCLKAGLKNVTTYINSGNVLFDIGKSNPVNIADRENYISAARKIFIKILRDMTGKDINLTIRSENELQTILKSNPFPNAEPSKIGIVLMDIPISSQLQKELKEMKWPGPEIVSIAKNGTKAARELFIYYVDGMGRSKLKLPNEFKAGTMRNLNSLSKIFALIKKNTA